MHGKNRTSKMPDTVWQIELDLLRKVKMKNSNIPWLGEIPDDWEVQRLKFLFAIKKDIAKSLGYNVLSVTQRGLKIKDITLNEGQLAMDYSKYQLVAEDDFVMNHMDLLTGWVDCSQYRGVTSPDYRVFKIKKNDICQKNYYKYLFQVCYQQKIFYGIGQGVSNFGRWRLQSDVFLNFPIPLPPLLTQKAIADFLDKKCGEIDVTIEKTKATIEKYKKLKQSIITEAVTKGLKQDVPMRDSGIEWIGEIPEGWEIIRLKFLCNVITGTKDTVDRDDDGDYPFYVRSPKVEKINSVGFEGEAILMAGDGVGAGKVFHYANGKFDFHQRVYNLHNFKNINAKFLHFYLSNNFWKEIEKGNAKSTVDSIRLPMIQNFPTCIPPLEEQQEIVDFLDKKTAIIDDIITKKEALLEKLTGYKKSLIYEAVTGKLGV